jgi:hypothetical protein
MSSRTDDGDHPWLEARWRALWPWSLALGSAALVGSIMLATREEGMDRVDPEYLHRDRVFVGGARGLPDPLHLKASRHSTDRGYTTAMSLKIDPYAITEGRKPAPKTFA